MLGGYVAGDKFTKLGGWVGGWVASAMLGGWVAGAKFSEWGGMGRWMGT